MRLDFKTNVNLSIDYLSNLPDGLSLERRDYTVHLKYQIVLKASQNGIEGFEVFVPAFAAELALEVCDLKGDDSTIPMQVSVSGHSALAAWSSANCLVPSVVIVSLSEVQFLKKARETVLMATGEIDEVIF